MPFELGITKDELLQTKQQFAQSLSYRFDPREFLKQHSNLLDLLVKKAFRQAQTQVSAPSTCLLAVGGYGRDELAPYSDVDLLLLYTPSKKEGLSLLIEKILFPLWDLGLDISCPSRSIQECLKMAQSDLHVKTSLMEARYIDGEYELFQRFYSLFTKKVLHQRVKGFAEALAKDLHLRHQKYGDPVYILEPNLKEGGGGLRDFQIGRWLIRAKFKTDRWNSILSPDQSRILKQSLQYLWALRIQLHLLSGRRQDHLTFDLQERIASVLGFSSDNKGIEEMMRQYHLSTQRISTFTQDILDRTLEESPWKKAFFYLVPKKKIDENFGIASGRLYLLDPLTFKKDPTQLMTLFEYAQTYKVKMDVRTEESVVESLPFIDDSFRHSEKVNKVFLSILRRGESVDFLLRKMHALGFLSRYLPEFSELEGRIHYDLYHVHPVDIHSLLAVEELRKLRDAFYQKEYPLLTTLIQEVERPELLFLTTLLHDIGKGRDGNHSLRGGEIIQEIGRRMGLSPAEQDWMRSLVEKHLLMVETALRRDLHDEQVILRFTNQMKNLDQLKGLYLLTFADIKAVGPEAWTSWKHTLLMELFLKASHLFKNSAIPGPFLKRDPMIKRLHQLLPEAVISEYAEYLPDRYLASTQAEEIVHHMKMVRRVEGEFLVVEWVTKDRRQAKVTICTKDRYGLFSKITGCFYLCRLNILEAQIHTWENGIALDTFWVEDATEDLEHRLEKFKKDLKEVLVRPTLLKTLLSQEETNRIGLRITPRVSPEVRINNQESDFYTIIEVTGEDRLGILYEITQALTDFGCDIHFARISTLGNRIVDVFYVQTQLGEKIEEDKTMDQLKRTLLRRLESPEKKNHLS